MKKRSQAALEFLTTYGWALLVILILIGALAYFGVLNPQRFLPDRCNISPGFTCDEYQITDGNITVILTNKLGAAIQINNASFDSREIGFSCSVSDINTVIDADQRITINCTDEAEIFPPPNNKLKMTFEVDYTPVMGSLPQKILGEIFATIR